MMSCEIGTDCLFYSIRPKHLAVPQWKDHLRHLPSILVLYRDNGKENGSYYNGLYRGSIGIMEKMETPSRYPNAPFRYPDA